MKKKHEEVCFTCFLFSAVLYDLFFVLLADAEKLDYDSDRGGRNKKKGGGISKNRSPVKSKKRPAHSPPSTVGKKKKR